MNRIGIALLLLALPALAVAEGAVGLWLEETPSPHLQRPDRRTLTDADIADGADGCRIVFSNRSQLTPPELAGLKDFLAGGGVLVAGGTFGSQRLEGAPDTTGTPGEELGGCRIVKAGAAVHRLWALPGNPLFDNFHHEQWLDYPDGQAVVLELTSASTIPLALADFRPAGWRKPGFQFDYYSTRYASRTAVYAAVTPLGAGLVVRLADDLATTADPAPIQNAILENALLPTTPVTLRQTQARLRRQPIAFALGNLLPNGDFNQVVMAHGVEKIDKNRAAGIIAMPCGWSFNSWNGAFSGQALLRPGTANDYVLLTTGDGADSRGGGATWTCRLDFIRLRPGEACILALRARGQDVVKSSCSVRIEYEDNTPGLFTLPLPAGTFPEQDFQLNLAIDPLRLPKPGCTISLILGGTGRIEVDNIALTIAKE